MNAINEKSNRDIPKHLKELQSTLSDYEAQYNFKYYNFYQLYVQSIMVSLSKDYNFCEKLVIRV